ncbi:hypothetical protein [Geminocystis herdmanii]|uniref:hypothetical protein n=1 Tax=Geminocystis herdmanii TaxID=669359 RepID=UPI00034DBEEE|nr:hypothetical protein [Geminocystis herdmanii]
MTQEKFIPDIEQIKKTSLKFQELCKRMDAEILILDDIIAQLDEQNRNSPVYQYRLNKAKRLLEIESPINV